MGESSEARNHAPFFGGLPERGIWTAVGLTRGQFFAILGLSTLLFILIGGPVWSHLREGHFTRIVVSYGMIPLAVVAALYRNGTPRLSLILTATGVLALLKLLITASLLIVFALARS